MSDMTAEEIQAKTDIARHVLREAGKWLRLAQDPDSMEGQELWDAGDAAVDQSLIAFWSGLEIEGVKPVLRVAQQISEKYDDSLIGVELEYKDPKGEIVTRSFTQDDLFQLETDNNAVAEAASNGHAEEEKTINNVIKDYGNKSKDEIVNLMKSLSDEEVQQVKAHEAEHEARPGIVNFTRNPADEEKWEGEPSGEYSNVPTPEWSGDPQESKEYEQEQDAPVDEDFAKEASSETHLRTKVDQIFTKYFKAPDYSKRRWTSISNVIENWSDEEVQTLYDYESLPYVKGGPRHRKEVLPQLEELLDHRKTLGQTSVEDVDQKETEPEATPAEEPKFNPATQKMEPDSETQVAEIPTENVARAASGIGIMVDLDFTKGTAEVRETYEEQKQRLREERLAPKETPIQPRQQGEMDDLELDQRALKELAALGMPEPEMPEGTPKLPRDIDRGVYTNEMLDQDLLLWSAHEGYALYQASKYEAERVAKKVLADKAANGVRQNIGIMTEDGKHKKLEAQIDAEVERDPTVAQYREEQKFAEVMHHHCVGHAAFYGACKWGLSRVMTDRHEESKGTRS